MGRLGRDDRGFVVRVRVGPVAEPSRITRAKRRDESGVVSRSLALYGEPQSLLPGLEATRLD